MVPLEPLNRATSPSTPTGAITRFGTVCPGTKFRFEAVGRDVLSPYTVTYPGLVAAVTVTFNTTADTAPVPGTPPRPATCRCTVPPAATATRPAPSPVRVSNKRDGANDVKAPAALTAAAEAAPA